MGEGGAMLGGALKGSQAMSGDGLKKVLIAVGAVAAALLVGHLIAESSDSTKSDVQVVWPTSSEVVPLHTQIRPKKVVLDEVKTASTGNLGRFRLLTRTVSVDDTGMLMLKRGVAAATKSVAAKEICSSQFDNVKKVHEGIEVTMGLINHGESGDVIGCHIQIRIDQLRTEAVAVVEQDSDTVYLAMLMPLKAQ